MGPMWAVKLRTCSRRKSFRRLVARGAVLDLLSVATVEIWSVVTLLERKNMAQAWYFAGIAGG